MINDSEGDRKSSRHQSRHVAFRRSNRLPIAENLFNVESRYYVGHNEVYLCLKIKLLTFITAFSYLAVRLCRLTVLSAINLPGQILRHTSVNYINFYLETCSKLPSSKAESAICGDGSFWVGQQLAICIKPAFGFEVERVRKNGGVM